MRFKYPRNRSTRRRAATVVLVVITLPVIIGFGALSVDVGVLYGTRADLQNAADAAALAGAAALTTEQMMQVRMESGSIVVVRNEAVREIQTISKLNSSFGVTGTVVEQHDISIGWIDLTSGSSPLQTTAPATSANAVRAMVRRSEGSENGPVNLMFATIFGKALANVSASAVAAFDDRVSGIETRDVLGGVLPLTMDVDDYAREMTTGVDEFSFDADGDSVAATPNGTREVIVFPGNSAPGNFGLLNIGTPNQGLPAIANQIENGVAPEDFETEVGTSELTFHDGTDPTTYDITGNPGFKANLEVALQTRVGQIIAFFVHDNVSLSGSNAVYRVVGMRFGRVMQVNPKTSHADRGLWIRPVTHTEPAIKTNVAATSWGGAAGRIVLAR